MLQLGGFAEGTQKMTGSEIKALLLPFFGQERIDRAVDVICGRTPPAERPTPITDAVRNQFRGDTEGLCRALVRNSNDLERHLAEARENAIKMSLKAQAAIVEGDDWKAKAIANEVSKEIAQRISSACGELKAQLAEVTRQRDELRRHLDAATNIARDRQLAAISAEDALEKITAQRDALAEALEVAMARAYAAGYQHGHDDSVEARFIIVDQAEAKEHFAEDVKQMLLDGSQPEAAAALAAIKEPT